MKAKIIRTAKAVGAKWKTISPEGRHALQGAAALAAGGAGGAALGAIWNKHSRKKHPKSAKAYDKMKAGKMTHAQVIKVMKKEGAM